MEKNNVRSLNIDQAIKQTSGGFQILTTVLFGLATAIGGFITVAMPLLLIYPQFECFNQETQTYERWERETACHLQDWRLDWTSERTLNNWIVEMNLYCSEKWMIGLLGSIYFQGHLLGSVLLSNLPDIYGRKSWVRYSLFFHIVLFTIMMFSPDIYMKYTLNFLLGIAGSVRIASWMTAGSEFLSKENRIYSSITCQLLMSWISITLAWYFWFVSNQWVYYYYVVLAISVITAILCFLIPESPRWLVSVKREKEAKEILNKIARFNSKEQLPEDIELVNDILVVKGSTEKITQDDNTKSPFKILWSNRILRYNLIFVCFLWLIGCLMNHFINYYIKYIKTESIFAIFLIAGTADIISKGIYTTMMKYLPFREGTWALILMGIFSSLWYIFLSFNTSMIITIVFWCKMFAGTTFASTFYASNMMFESKVSTTAFGISNICGKVGASLAPMMAELPGIFPMICYSGSGLVAIFSIWNMKIPQLANQNKIWEIKKSS